MSETRFTPGKWKAHKVSAPGRDYDGTFEIHYSADGECVAETVHEEVDAHLMAASKEMYVACLAAIQVMSGPEYGGAPGTTDAVTLLRHALTKANPPAISGVEITK